MTPTRIIGEGPLWNTIAYTLNEQMQIFRKSDIRLILIELRNIRWN